MTNKQTIINYIKNLLSFKHSVKDNDSYSDFCVAGAGGWFKIDFLELINSKAAKELELGLRYNIHDWGNKINKVFFENVKWYSKSDLIKHSNVLKRLTKKKDEEKVLSTKRMLTMSSILYNFSIPKNLFLLDGYTFNYLIKYHILTELYEIDLENMSYGIVMENKKMSIGSIYYVPVAALNKCVNCVSDNLMFKNRIDNLETVYRLPNIVDMRNMILASNEYRAIEDLSIPQFKKVLTCVFLISGLSIPADYLHIDIEVVDYVGVNTQTKRDSNMDIVNLNISKQLQKETK